MVNLTFPTIDKNKQQMSMQNTECIDVEAKSAQFALSGFLSTEKILNMPSIPLRHASSLGPQRSIAEVNKSFRQHFTIFSYDIMQGWMVINSVLPFILDSNFR